MGAAGLQQSPPPWGMPPLASGCPCPLAYLLVFSVFLRRMDPKVWCHGLVRVPEGEEKGSKMCPAATGGDFWGRWVHLVDRSNSNVETVNQRAWLVSQRPEPYSWAFSFPWPFLLFLFLLFCAPRFFFPLLFLFLSSFLPSLLFLSVSLTQY